jgi:hypothetical protein
MMISSSSPFIVALRINSSVEMIFSVLPNMMDGCPSMTILYVPIEDRQEPRSVQSSESTRPLLGLGKSSSLESVFGRGTAKLQHRCDDDSLELILEATMKGEPDEIVDARATAALLPRLVFGHAGGRLPCSQGLSGLMHQPCT